MSSGVGKVMYSAFESALKAEGLEDFAEDWMVEAAVRGLLDRVARQRLGETQQVLGYVRTLISHGRIRGIERGYLESDQAVRAALYEAAAEHQWTPAMPEADGKVAE